MLRMLRCPSLRALNLNRRAGLAAGRGAQREQESRSAAGRGAHFSLLTSRVSRLANSSQHSIKLMGPVWAAKTTSALASGKGEVLTCSFLPCSTFPIHLSPSSPFPLPLVTCQPLPPLLSFPSPHLSSPIKLLSSLHRHTLSRFVPPPAFALLLPPSQYTNLSYVHPSARQPLLPSLSSFRHHPVPAPALPFSLQLDRSPSS